MNKERAREITRAFKNLRVVVVGDVMLDEYIWGQVQRISPEAPVMVLEAESQSHVPGGAANVVNNLCALRARSVILGVIGCDEPGRTLAAALQERGAETTGLLALDDRPTSRKTRIIAHSQQVIRIDKETRAPIPADSIRRLEAMLEELVPGADAVLLSDYQKGVLVPEVLRACVRLAHLYQKPVTGNLKPACLSRDCALTVVTLNLVEAAQASGLAALGTDEQVARAGQRILASTGARHVLITRGAQGLSLCSADAPEHPAHVPACPVAVYDVAGAGDTVISAMTLALAAGASPLEAVTLANYAASQAVKKVGVATVTRRDILASVTDASRPPRPLRREARAERLSSLVPTHSVLP